MARSNIVKFLIIIFSNKADERMAVVTTAEKVMTMTLVVHLIPFIL